MKTPAALLAILLGCGDPPLPAPDAPENLPPDAAIGRTITGTWVDRHVTAGGEVAQPVDLTTLTFAAYVPPTFERIAGAGAADGTFTIPNVPDGTYYLQIDQIYIVTDRSQIDFSSDVLGRTNVEPVLQPSPITFDVGNLQTWQAGDELQMFVAGSGTIGFAMQNVQPPPLGATALAGFAYDLSGADYRADIDGVAGDRVILTQLATQTVGGRTFRAVARSFEPAAFTIGDGGSATLTGNFAVPGATATLDVVWSRDSFDQALRPAVPGTEVDNYSVLGASVLPEANTRGLYHPAPDLVVFEPGYGADRSNVIAAWPYRDPFPTTWTRTLSARYFTYRFLQPEAGSPIPVFASIDVDVDRATLLPGAQLSPLVGPVGGLVIDGRDAFSRVTGMGTTPTIAWQAPLVGTASRYLVTVAQVTSSLVSKLRILTSDTSVQVPPGVIEPGASYVFAVRADASSVDATPAKTSLPAGTATIISEIATP